MIYILYSADYELYLGANTLPEEAVLIQPTERLLATCEQLGIPLTLFADVACLWRYQELGQNRFPDLAWAQLVDAARRHHDVQTHLHPHWHYTRFQDQQFLFDADKYLLGSVDPDPKQRFHLIRHWLQRAADSLTERIRPHVPTYRCLAFRAGGWGLQPDEKRILKALRETGYRIDSSIIPGARLTTNVQQIDFTRVPDLANYWLDEESGLATPAPAGRGIFEIPVAAARLDTWARIRLQAPAAARLAWSTLRQTSPSPPSRGEPCNQPASTRPRNRWQHAYWRAQATLSNRFIRLELGTNPQSLLTCLDLYLKKFHPRQPDQPIFLALNCHPKGLHPPHLKTLERFHTQLLHHSREPVRAITFQQAWEILSSTTPPAPTDRSHA